MAVAVARLDDVAMDSMSHEDQQALGERVGKGVGRVLEVVFTTFATAVFVLLWIYIAAAVFTDGGLLADTWAWYEGLELVGRVVVGIAILPVIVFLWAWQADLGPLLFGLVMLLMIGWSFIAFQGTARLVVRRARR